MKKLDLVMIAILITLLVTTFYFLKTLKSEGAQCLVNPYKVVIDDIQKRTTEPVTCSCNYRNSQLVFSKDDFLVTQSIPIN